MSDTTVSVSFGGTTAEFEAACQRALTAMRALTDGVTALTSGLATSTQGLNATTPAVVAVTQATNTATTAIKQISPAAKAATVDLQALINATTGVSRESQSAAASADVFRQALGDQTNEVKALRAGFDETTAAAGRTMHGSSGITRELIVLGHEAMMGNFSRFGGSLVVMAELMGNISIKTILAGGAIVAAGAAVYHLYENLHQATVQAESLNAQMVLMGRDPVEATAAAKALATQLHEAGDVGKTAAREIAGAFAGIAHSTPELTKQLALLVPALHAATPTEDIAKFGAEFAKIGSSVGNIKKFLDENDLFDGAAQREAIEGYVRTNNLIGAQELLIKRVNDRLGDQFAAQQAAKKRNLIDSQIASGLPGLAEQIAPTSNVPKLKMTESARSPADALLDEEQAKLNTHKHEEIELDHTIQALRERLAATSDKAARDDVANALHVAAEKRATMREAGDTTWLAQQTLALDKQNLAIMTTARTSKAATDAKLANDVAYWSRVLSGTEISTSQRAQAERNLATAEIQLSQERLRAKEAADRAGVTSGRKSVQEQIAELSAEQAANHDNYAKWMEIEREKLAILRGAYSEKSKEFQSELRAEEVYQRQHLAKIEALELQRIDRENATGQKALGERVSRLGVEVAEQLRSKSDELAISRQLTEAEAALELRKLDTFVASLTQGTAEFQKATLQRADLYQTFQSKMAAIDKQIADEAKRSADRSLATYTSAFDRIGAAGESMATGLVSGTMTWKQAEQQAATAVLQGVAQLAGKILASWAATEIGKTMTTTAQTQIRTAQENGATGLAVIGKALAAWVGLEGGKTAATVGGAAIREGVDTTAAGVAVVDSKISGLAQIATNAAVAGSAAFASTAAIPMIGPELAPAAGAAAFAGAGAYAGALAVPSFAVGAWSLPGDMLAQVHNGEMIVPAFQAEAMRNGAQVGGGGGGAALHVTLNAIDTQSGAAFLNAQLPFLAKRLQQHMSLNASSRS